MYIIISVNYGEVTMVIYDIFEVLRIRKIIELLQYFLITLHTLMVTMIKKNNWSYVKTMSCVILELRST